VRHGPSINAASQWRQEPRTLGAVVRGSFFVGLLAAIAPAALATARLQEPLLTFGLHPQSCRSAEGSESGGQRATVLQVPAAARPEVRRIRRRRRCGRLDARAIRSDNRALLISSIARGCRWLNELITEPTASAASIATRDDCSVRKVNMTISLAFLAPDLVKAAIEGRLPHGMGVVRLADLPAEWSRQQQMLGLLAQ